MSDHYTTLGLERNATKEEIKKAFRKLVMEHHPDKGGDENKFKEINEAYSVLYNDEKRQQYDNPNPFGGFTGFPGFRQRPQKPDLNAPRDGQFIGVEAEIPLTVFIFGGPVEVKISYNESCSDCGGKGFDKGDTCSQCLGEGYVQHVQRRPGFMSTSMQPCPTCGGLGVTSTERCETCSGKGRNFIKDKEFKFELPAGSGPGSKHILSGVGRTGVNGGRNGDVGLMIVGIKAPNLNKLTPEKVEELKELLGDID
jgi:molecular chaperone DnaJ